MSTLTVQSNKERIEKQLNALYNSVELGQGRFILVLMETRLENQAEIIQRISQDFKLLDADFNTLQLKVDTFIDVNKGYHPIDLLKKTKELTDKPLNLLFITGLGQLFGENPIVNGLSSKQLMYALQPINMGRIFLQEEFKFPVIFCLESKDMEVFLRIAPDFTSCRSMYLDFTDFENN